MDNNNMKKQYNNFVEVERMLQFLDIQEVTTKRQKANGTREFKLPVKDQYGGEIHVASFASGYVRRTKTGGSSSDWQLNKRIPKDRFYPEYKHVELSDGSYTSKKTGKYKKFITSTCKLIPNEQDRLEYLIAFCLKNYYIGQANMLSSGNFIPKWKYESEVEKRINEINNFVTEVSVTVNGVRHKIL